MSDTPIYDQLIYESQNWSVRFQQSMNRIGRAAHQINHVYPISRAFYKS